MSELVQTAMHAAGIGPRLKAALEYGPIVGFVAVLLVLAALFGYLALTVRAARRLDQPAA